MVVLGLLLLALVCLILGLIDQRGVPDRIGRREHRGRHRAVAPARSDGGQVCGGLAGRVRGESGAGDRQTSLVTGTAFAGQTTDTSDDGAAAANGAAHEDDVWVVDGQPLFHARGCDQLAGHDAEPVPYAQAVDDGFTECSACKPPVGADVTEVWVVDGRPEYHLPDCAQLSGDGQQIPRAQAVEDGFTPCADCRPDTPAAPEPKPAAAAATESTAAPAESPADTPAPTDAAADSVPPAAAEVAPAATNAAAAPAATTADAAGGSEPKPAAPTRVSSRPDGVWVVDGRPRYHLADCMIIKDTEAEEVPVAQATEDGFIPCTMCEPNVSRV